jgi:UDP-2-acetamido-3-amino-2,3-dideoxy-glucuronate N-acetyltransferase
LAPLIHKTAEVADNATIGENTKIWHHGQIRPNAVIGENCNFGKGVFIDEDVQIGDNVKIQNYVSVYHGVTIENGVFIGPHACFTNDMRPRAINVDGSPKSADDWKLSKTLVKKGAAIGANSTIRCGITVGEWVMIGSGSVVTKNVPDYGLVFGNPARLRGFVCPCGEKLEKREIIEDNIKAVCPDCGYSVNIKQEVWREAK